MTTANTPSPVADDASTLPAWQWAIRIVAVVVQLILAYLCTIEGELFFYQGF